MKIYVEKQSPSHINVDTLKDLDRGTYVYKDCYSKEGIYRIIRNKVYKLNPKDETRQYLDYKNIHLIIDKSKYSFSEKYYHIPHDHYMVNIEHSEYKINPKSGICFNVIKQNNTINDIFFYTDEEILDDNLIILLSDEINVAFISLY